MWRERRGWPGTAEREKLAALPGSEQLGSLRAQCRSEQPMGENSMGRWFKQQGVVYSLLTMRRSSLCPCAFHCKHSVGSSWVTLHARQSTPNMQFLTPSWQTCMVSLQCHGLNMGLDFMVSTSHFLKSGIKTCLLLETVQVQQVRKQVEVFVYHWQGGCILNPESSSCSPTLYQRHGGGWY